MRKPTYDPTEHIYEESYLNSEIQIPYIRHEFLPVMRRKPLFTGFTILMVCVFVTALGVAIYGATHVPQSAAARVDYQDGNE